MFPRQVPLLVTEVKAHDTGFTDPQMVALEAAIRFIKPSFQMHARKISVILFEAYPKYLPYFKSTPPDNSKLHASSDGALQFITDLIEHGIRNIDLFKREMATFVKSFQLHRLEVQDVLNISSIYKEYFKSVLMQRMSNTLIEAIDIFFDGFVKTYESNDD